MENKFLIEPSTEKHKAGFVSIIGKPNVGKSTLMNAMMGEKLAITTSKAQTTRHRIMGILSDENYQMVYSDTPGIIKPGYELHKRMMDFVRTSLQDADIILFVTDIYEKYDEEEIIQKLRKIKTPIFLVINKVDIAKQKDILEKIEYWKETLEHVAEIFAVSALEKFNIDAVFEKLLAYLPEHPPYFPKDEMTDRPERFFVSEMIREKIFLNYKKEVPYSCEVVVKEFKEEETIIRIHVDILVERKSQKGILIGKGGTKLKKVGTEARLDLEKFFGKKIFLAQYVKIEPDWRHKKAKLEALGYV